MAEEEEQDKSFAKYLKKPLYYWIQPFVSFDLLREDTLAAIVGSDVLQQLLQFLEIQTAEIPSETWLSSLPGAFDEDTASVHSVRPKYDTDIRERTRKLSGICKLLRQHYFDHFDILLLVPPPNVLQIATLCEKCGVAEMEKMLRLLLGAAVYGHKKQEVMRTIRGFPFFVQEQLIQEIKQITESPDLVKLKSWTDFRVLPEADQQQVYENMKRQCQVLVGERDASIERLRLVEYGFGVTKCEAKGSHLNRYDFNTSHDLDKGDKNNCGTLRQLKEELSEKSELLKECRHELEVTKSKLDELNQEMNEMRSQLKSYKFSRDEFDILREGQEKAVRLEAELSRMRKKVEESEQYYEQTQILENENKVYQRKHAILTDRINVLTVENERLELSLLTHQSHRSPFPHNSPFISFEQPPTSISYTPNLNSFTEELLLDSDGDTAATKTETKLQSLDSSPDVQKNEKPSSSKPTATTLNCEESEKRNVECETPTSKLRPQKERKNAGPKRSKRRSGAVHGKRTKKTSLFPPAKVTLQKVRALEQLTTNVQQHPPSEEPKFITSMDKHGIREPEVIVTSSIGSKDEQRTEEMHRNSASKHVIHDSESDADAELSQSPQRSDSDFEIPKLGRRPAQVQQSLEPEGFGSEDELFFVCSTNQAPSIAVYPSIARNVRIFGPSRDSSVLLRPNQNQSGRDTLLGSHSLMSHPTVPLSVNIQLKQRQELTVGRDLTGISPIQNHPIRDQDSFTARENRTDVCGITTDEEDDDSIWYEYGCV